MNWLQRLLSKLFPQPRVIYTGELPPFLKEVVDDYLTAHRSGEKFSFTVRMVTSGGVIDIAICPHCKQRNKLDSRGIVGARCAACGLSLELLPKARRKVVVQ